MEDYKCFRTVFLEAPPLARPLQAAHAQSGLPVNVDIVICLTPEDAGRETFHVLVFVRMLRLPMLRDTLYISPHIAFSAASAARPAVSVRSMRLPMESGIAP